MRVTSLLLVLLLTGCASLDKTPTTTLTDAHVEALLALDHWTIRGRLNIRGENEARTVNLLWEQQTDAFNINLSGNLGIGTVLLYGDDQGVVMEEGNEAPYHAGSLSDISADLLGYDYPARHLLYWIRGLPAPGSPHTEERDAVTGLLTTLQQDDWTLEFDRYETRELLVLPGRIRLENGRFRLTFLIQDWEIPG